MTVRQFIPYVDRIVSLSYLRVDPREHVPLFVPFVVVYWGGRTLRSARWQRVSIVGRSHPPIRSTAAYVYSGSLRDIRQAAPRAARTVGRLVSRLTLQ